MAREAIEDALRFEHPLRRYTSFRVGGCAEVFAEPTDMGQLQEVLRYVNEQGLDVSVLGKGCNVLISDDGVRGMVVHLTGWYFNRIERRADGMIVCGGGANLPRLVADTAQWGFEGLETLVGVPGSLGGAVAMNAGGRHGAIGSYVRGVTSIGYDGEIHRYGREEIEFGYRRSSLSNEIIMEAELELVPGDKDVISTRMSDIFHQKKKTQPLRSRSAGCVFKNPEGHSAGALIDTLGLKSMRIGDAAVSGKHANFIINMGSATASQIMELICKIRDEVKWRYGQILDMEIKIW